MVEFIDHETYMTSSEVEKQIEGTFNPNKISH